MTSSVSNNRNFSIFPNAIIMSPYETKDVKILFTPSRINITQESDIVFENDIVGSFRYLTRGIGVEPKEPIMNHITTTLHYRLSKMITFRNPFDVPIKVKVSMDKNKQQRNAFQLFMKSRLVTVKPNSVIQIPYIFCPDKMMKYETSVIIACDDIPTNVLHDMNSTSGSRRSSVSMKQKKKSLIWRHKIEGVATVISKKVMRYTCA
eukprot:UN23654